MISATWLISGFFLNLIAVFIIARREEVDMDLGQVFGCALLSFMGPTLFGLFTITIIGMALCDVPVFKRGKK